ncbi:MAG TPA: hypothetical protein GX696_05055 [Pseudomonadaceae bacterium]|nr:hypothetical protein [Pseudomonadaceae bacterium]
MKRASSLIGHLCRSVCLLLLSAPLWGQQTAPGLMDISIQVFTHAARQEGLPPAPGPSGAAMMDESAVQAAEARYVPMLLRYRLEATGRFGAVRVLPLLDNGAELMISGQILVSNEEQLSLSIEARDSSGRLWIGQRYDAEARSVESLNADPLLEDDFQALYANIVRDLLAVLDQLPATELEEIRNLALLHYGAALVPHHFTDFVRQSDNGRTEVLRLPAHEDPLLQRIEAIREREYLFIDVVDEEYRRFYADIKPVYDMWREYRREEVLSAADKTARAQSSTSDFARGSYYALQESYNNYRWAKLQAIYLDELREGFANETAPTDLELSDSLYRLTGTLEQQYREWRGILAELYELEVTGQ